MSQQENPYSVSSGEAVSTASSVTKYWDWLQSPHDNSVPTSWSKCTENDKERLLRVLITYPEFCRHFNISLPPDNLLRLGRIRDDLMCTRHFTLSKWVQMEDRILEDWWQGLTQPSRWQMWRMSRLSPEQLRNVRLWCPMLLFLGCNKKTFTCYVFWYLQGRQRCASRNRQLSQDRLLCSNVSFPASQLLVKISV